MKIFSASRRVADVLCAALLASLPNLASAQTDASGSASSPASASTPFPRVAVRAGYFINASSGQPYVPLGANYCHVAPLSDGRPGHATFSPAYYDPADMEQMMATLAAGGMNTVRAFQMYDDGPNGILVSPDAQDISPGYLANVVDFLRAARRHNIHVIFTWDTWNPTSKVWAALPLSAEAQDPLPTTLPPDMGINSRFLSLPWARVRFNAILSLINGIRHADPDLLRVVMAWELENEVSFDVKSEPFKSRPHDFSCEGKTYDIATDPGAQDFMDDAFIRWANLGADTIHAADPDSLVSVSVFPFNAVGRAGPDHYLEDKTQDNRIPVRPMAFLHTRLDYTDMHVYAWKGPEGYEATYRKSMQSEEAPALEQEAARLGKPLFVGETGVFSQFLKAPGSSTIDYSLGITPMTETLQRLKADGISGALYWEYGNRPASPKYEGAPLRWFPAYIPAFVVAWNSLDNPATPTQAAASATP